MTFWVFVDRHAEGLGAIAWTVVVGVFALLVIRFAGKYLD